MASTNDKVRTSSLNRVRNISGVETSTDDIACWFLETDYDGQSFFVRQAYFCGATDPYECLKADIDESEWAKLASTTSQPFRIPANGTIAVKVVNHFGAESLKVLTLGG